MKQKKEKQIRTVGKILFIVYILFLVYFLLFSDWYGRTGPAGEYRYNLILFTEIRRFMEYRQTLGIFAVFTNLAGNILVFIPFGFFMPMASKYKSLGGTLVYSFGVSLCVEVFQLVMRVGCFDVDDLLLNTLGGVLGHGLYILCRYIRRRHFAGKGE